MGRCCPAPARSFTRRCGGTARRYGWRPGHPFCTPTGAGRTEWCRVEGIEARGRAAPVCPWLPAVCGFVASPTSKKVQLLLCLSMQGAGAAAAGLGGRRAVRAARRRDRRGGSPGCAALPRRRSRMRCARPAPAPPSPAPTAACIILFCLSHGWWTFACPDCRWPAACTAYHCVECKFCRALLPAKPPPPAPHPRQPCAWSLEA